MRSIQTNAGSITALALSTDGKTLITGSDVGTIFAWDLNSDLKQASYQLVHGQRQSTVSFLQLSKDGHQLVSSSGVNTYLWKLPDQDRSASVQMLRQDVATTALAWSQDGTVLVTGGSDGSVRVWRINDSLPNASVRTLVGHTRAVYAIAINNDAGIIQTASDDNTMRTWSLDLETLKTKACAVVGRNLTQEEWRQYFGDTPYRKTCRNLP
jgi:WD40 repeat protein